MTRYQIPHIVVSTSAEGGSGSSGKERQGCEFLERSRHIERSGEAKGAGWGLSRVRAEETEKWNLPTAFIRNSGDRPYSSGSLRRRQSV